MRRGGRLRGVAVAVVLAASAVATRAGAQIAVFDAGAYSQQVLTAARALEQIQNQVAALVQQHLRLVLQGRNLSPLGYSAVPQLQADMAQVNGLLAQAGRVANDVAAIRGEFDRDYSGIGSDQALASAATGRWQNALDAFRHVLEVQATVADSMASTEGQVGRLASESQGAEGALQAAQAGDQLLAVQAKQLADLTAILSAQSRAEALDAAGRAAAAAEGRARLQRFLGAGGAP
jgi:P-type conjugative transfer protein TrbJ